LVETDELVDRMARYEPTLTRLCISMVTHGRAYPDTVDITRRIRARVATPLSILVAPPTLNRERLESFKAAGVDMIGIGLDAVTEELFAGHRSNVPSGGGLSWDKYWEVVDDSRELFGPWKVNCHTLVGLGETDYELVSLFVELVDRQVFPYLFCFNPEPDSRLADHPKSPIRRWRRMQLAKHLIEEKGFRMEHFDFDDEGSLTRIAGDPAEPDDIVRAVVESGIPFMTDGCPGPQGEPGCTRPYGSYGPAEPFRDFPFLPEGEDMTAIRSELALGELHA
jgi:biotin synthase